MWDERLETNGRIEQVWFAGAHSNVGGGYPKEGMSLVALHWMMAKARAQGLRFSRRALEDYGSRQNVNDKLYDPRCGLAAYYRYAPRNIGKICEENGIRPTIHRSVFERIARATDAYAPGNLPSPVQVVDTQPAPSVDARLAAQVNLALINGRGELEMATKWVSLRRSLQYFLMAATAGLLAAAYWKGATLLANWRLAFGLLLGSCLLSRLARARIAAIYSTFWRRALREVVAASPSAPTLTRTARRIPGLVVPEASRAYEGRSPLKLVANDAQP